MTGRRTLAYWVTRPGVGELRSETLHPAGNGSSLVRAEFSAVSPGTERLVGLGLVPPDCAEQMACRAMRGDFALPVKYGYSLVGTGVAGSLAGRRVFLMHPHQGLARIPDAQALEIPAAIPSARATLVPNLETALNGVWDADLHENETVLVVGGGIVGLLSAYVLARLHRPASVVDRDPRRVAGAARCPWIGRAVEPPEVEAGSFDVALHATGTGSGLQAAIDAIGFEGRVIDLSWYGTRPVTLDLGTSFHPQRKRIVASQVSHVARPKRATQSRRERLDAVLALLQDPALEFLLGDPVPFAAMPEAMARVYAGASTDPLPLIRYATNREHG